MNSYKKTVLLLFPLVVLFSLLGIYFLMTGQPAKRGQNVPAENSTLPVSLARQAAQYIKARDFVSLSDLVDSYEGLTVVPYYIFGDDNGRNLSQEEVKNFFSDPAEKLWGYQDGSGLLLIYTGAKYYDKYIYPYDFVSLGSESLNKSLATGNTLPLGEVLENIYSDQILQGEDIQYVEYYIPGIDPKYEGMDWQALALVFIKRDTGWKLIGILHNEWTI